MNSAHFRNYILTFQLILLCACSPQSTPTPAATKLAANPAAAPVDIAGPQMTVGSSFLYADGSVLVPVPGGTFTMGGGKTDNPLHQVNLSDFWIYSTKVTNGQYAYCVSMEKCTPPSLLIQNPAYNDPLHLNDPMVGVNYDQSAAYCDFVDARLPTEAEWEKTARGPDGNIYPWGDGKPSCDRLNYAVCVGSPTPVNKYPDGRSYYHAFDMEGNALEWVSDWYQADYYLNAPSDNPTGPDQGHDRVVRSSAFNSGGDQTEAFNRFHSSPETQRNNLGFRCVVESDAVTAFAPFCQYPAVYGTDGIGGASTGQEIQVTCPPLTINQSPTCSGITPVTTVSFYAGWQWETTVSWTSGSCTTGGGGLGFSLTCTKDSHFRFCSECKVVTTLPPKCPTFYKWDANLQTCLGAGRPGTCLPGYVTDPAGQCCTVEPGLVAPTANPIQQATTIEGWPGGTGTSCPVGTWQVVVAGPPIHYACVHLPAASPYCKFANATLLSCSPTGGDGDNGGPGCSITQQSCDATCAPLGDTFNATACTCTCNAG